MIVGEDDFVIIVGKGAEHAGDGGIDAPDIRLFVEAGNEDRDLGPIIVDAMSHAVIRSWLRIADTVFSIPSARLRAAFRSEEHTSELQSLMRISYAVFCLP